MNAAVISLLKAFLTGAFIVAMSELAKRYSLMAAVLVALPLSTAMTVAWIYLDTQDAPRAAQFAASVLWLLPPGCLFLAALPLGVRFGFGFWESFAGSTLITLAVYYVYAQLLQRVFGVTL